MASPPVKAAIVGALVLGPFLVLAAILQRPSQNITKPLNPTPRQAMVSPPSSEAQEALARQWQTPYAFMDAVIDSLVSADQARTILESVDTDDPAVDLMALTLETMTESRKAANRLRMALAEIQDFREVDDEQMAVAAKGLAVSYASLVAAIEASVDLQEKMISAADAMSRMSSTSAQ